MTLSALAEKTGARLVGVGDLIVDKSSPLEDAVPGSLSFIDNPRYIKYLADTKAAAVFCTEKLLDKVPDGTAALVHETPYKAYG